MIYDDHISIVSSLYLAPVEYYAAIFQSNRTIIEIHDNYQKQSFRNRCIIAGANGPVSLSIPVEKTITLKSKMKDIRISEHGNWRHLHWNAITSAYNSTPYFQYFEDEFRLFYGKKNEFLHDFNEELRLLVFNLIGIETPVDYSSDYRFKLNENEVDLREEFHPKKKQAVYKSPEYYQVFYERNGFIANLSIIDLLFNLGKEARIYFNKVTKFPTFAENK